MKRSRRITLVAGLLIIAGMIAGVLSVVPVIEQPDYLLHVVSHKNQVIVGAFFQFLMIPAYVGFALCLYPILKTENSALSLGFVGFRLITAMFHFLGVIVLPVFLILSHEFVQAGAPEASYFQVLGELLKSGRDLLNHVALILALGIGDLFLFFILYQSKFVPRWLSIWGLLGTTLTIVASFMVLFGWVDVVTPLYLGMNMPLAVQSLVFTIWLMTKGFE